MRKMSMSVLMSRSIDRTALILFKPFSLKKWLCLLFIAWLAGALGGGGNMGSNYNDFSRKKADAAQRQTAGIQESARGHASPAPAAAAASAHKPALDKSGFAGFIIGSIALLLLVLFFVALALLLLWLGARFRFIWFKAMVNNDASIVAPFKEYGKEGNSLFLFHIALLAIIVGFVVLIGIWVFAVGSVTGVFKSEADWSLLNMLSTFFIPGMVFLAGILVAGVFGVYIDHFVVPIMALERCRFRPAWRRFVALFKDNASDFVLYIFVLIGLGIAAAIIVFFAALMLLIALALTAGIIFGIPYLLLVTFLKAKILFIISAVVLAIPFIAVAVLLLASVNLPFAVFFRSFSLYFLSSLQCGYMPLPLEGSEGGQGQ